MGLGTDDEDQVSPKGLDEGPPVAGVVCRVPAGVVHFPTGAVERLFSVQCVLQNTSYVAFAGLTLGFSYGSNV